MAKLQESTGLELKYIFVVGGGSRNELLNQYIADALGMEVVTGLTEATAVGNIIQQAIADKQIQNLEEGHNIVKNSFEQKIYYPENTKRWADTIVKVKHLFQ